VLVVEAHLIRVAAGADPGATMIAKTPKTQNHLTICYPPSWSKSRTLIGFLGPSPYLFQRIANILFKAKVFSADYPTKLLLAYYLALPVSISRARGPTGTRLLTPLGRPKA